MVSRNFKTERVGGGNFEIQVGMLVFIGDPDYILGLIQLNHRNGYVVLVFFKLVDELSSAVRCTFQFESLDVRCRT